VTSQDARPLLVRSAPGRTPLAVPAVLVVPVPVHPASPSTSTTASLPPAVPRESSPSARDSLRTSHSPPETVHFAFAFVADSGAPFPAAAEAAAAVPVLLVLVLSVPALWPAFVVPLAEPVQPTLA
jgi:hypothetical protein